MIVVCGGKPEEERLDRAWHRLQTAIQKRVNKSLSQAELDNECIAWIEDLASFMPDGTLIHVDG